ncbi:ABC transporter [Bacillus coahuilensis m2-6]|uniref:ABC transporter ATP-binding protein n=1 Tax=Bacillus coahuilensis TaxID=408580 RepID=UPI00075056B0|nr:ABC transporter ATP-binding protein [Bacillus coahuilensis]KUP04326.1 ABC transporter [Bacillus coahuilensis m2-6]
MTTIIQCQQLQKKFRGTEAVKNVSFAIEENTITGLIGHNGAGKTTLLNLIAGYTHPTAGTVRVFDQTPFNNLYVSSNTMFINDDMNFPTSLTLHELLQMGAIFYPNWNYPLSEDLLRYFNLKPGTAYTRLSTGMKSTFRAIFAIAARTPLTLFDEPTTGMDASVRNDFTRLLLKDYIEFPRTIVLSSHHLSEVEHVLEDVLILKNGEVLMHTSLDSLREYAVGMSGPKSEVEALGAGREILYQQKLGTEGLYQVVENHFQQEEIETAKQKGVTISGVSAEDVSTYLIQPKNGGIEDVYNRSE